MSSCCGISAQLTGKGENELSSCTDRCSLPLSLAVFEGRKL